jgi:hypothetical protein
VRTMPCGSLASPAISGITIYTSEERAALCRRTLTSSVTLHDSLRIHRPASPLSTPTRSSCCLALRFLRPFLPCGIRTPPPFLFLL